MDRLEQQLKDLGIDTLTIGSDRHGVQRRAFFAELDQTLEDVQRVCEDILGYGKQPDSEAH